MDKDKERRRRRRMPWLVIAIAIGAGLAATTAGVVSGVTAGHPVQAQGPAWLKPVRADLRSVFDWIDLTSAGRVATLSGQAPDAQAKAAGFAAGKAALAAAEADVAVVVDAISVAGGEAGVGAALAALGETPDAAACQKAFADTLAGRLIAFDTGRATISAESAALLDALTGAALICAAHPVEIGGHTDSRGADGANLTLSQARADAVRAYLVERGVAGDTLSAVGYGETRPLDPARTEEAYATNRRIEFTVSP